MFVARAAATVIVASGLFAIIVVATPLVGLRRHARASLVASLAGAALAVAVVVVQVVALLPHRELAAYIVTMYFLAMAHRLVQDAPYPFFWTPAWVYAIGSLLPLIPAGGVLALAAGHQAGRAARRIAIGTMVIGSCLLLAYVAGAVYAARATWDGIPL